MFSVRIFLRSDLCDSHINPSLNNDVGSCVSSYLKYRLNFFVCSAIEINLESSQKGSKCKFLHLTLFCNATKVIAQFDFLKEISLNALLCSFVCIFAYFCFDGLNPNWKRS